MIASVLYLPVEETRRELASRLLIACFAAERGIASVIGQQWLLSTNLRHMQRGLVLLKGNDAIQANNMAYAKGLGYATSTFEEEMFGVCSANQILRLYDPRGIEVCDLLLAQGEFQREVLAERYPQAVDRIRVVGNPRADLLSPTFLEAHRTEVENIRTRYGSFILINTNFGTVNASIGNVFDSFNACARVGLMNATTEQGRADFNAWCGWERVNFGAVVRFIDWIERNMPSLSIVLRPHPSENAGFWRSGYADHASIRVEVAGSFIPWLMAAEFLVHTGCTTGMEAVMMNRPAISLTPPGTCWHEHYLSNRINPTFADAATAGQFIAEELNGAGRITAGRDDVSAELYRHVAMSDGKLAAERTVDALLPLFGTINPRPWHPGPKFVTTIERNQHQMAKMNVGLADVSAELCNIARMLGRFDRVRAHSIGDALFCIDPVTP